MTLQIIFHSSLELVDKKQAEEGTQPVFFTHEPVCVDGKLSGVTAQ
jgi:uncharacterized protein (UPF0179 family)